MFEKPKTIESNNAHSMSESEARIFGTVQSFRRDPIATLELVKANVLDENPESSTVAVKAVDELELVYDSAHDIEAPANDVVDEEAKAFLSADKYSPEYYIAVLNLLASASYSYHEILTWVSKESIASDPNDTLDDRGLRVLFNQMFDKQY